MDAGFMAQVFLLPLSECLGGVAAKPEICA